MLVRFRSKVEAVWPHWLLCSNVLGFLALLIDAGWYQEIYQNRLDVGHTAHYIGTAAVAAMKRALTLVSLQIRCSVCTANEGARQRS
jgi:hypothetical protein